MKRRRLNCIRGREEKRGPRSPSGPEKREWDKRHILITKRTFSQ